MVNHVVRLAAYEPDPTAGDWLETFQTIKFGPEWKDAAMALYGLSRPAMDTNVALPIRSLNDLLRAAAPGVIATGRGVTTEQNSPWLYAANEVSTDLVAALVNTWVATLGPRQAAVDPLQQAELEEAISVVQESLTRTMPIWTESVVDLGTAGLTSGGTAAPDRSLFQLVPAVLAKQLARRPYRQGDEELHFRIVTTAQGAELVSWPPRPFSKKGRSWYYSCVVSLTVQTVPFTANLRVHAGIGVRRWVTGGRIHVPSDRGVGVYLAVTPPWTTGDDHTPRLSHNFVDYFDRGSRHEWRSRSTVELLPEIDIVGQYPSAPGIMVDPDRWLDGVDGITAAVAHSNVLPDHEVKAGIGPTERAQLDRWVELGLAPWLRRVSDLKRTGHRSRPAMRPKPRWPKVDEDVAGNDSRKAVAQAEANRAAGLARRAALTSALDGAPLEVELLWQSERVRDRLVSTLCELLNLRPQAQGQWEWVADGLTVRVNARRFGDPEASALPIPRAKGAELRQMVAEVNEKRRAQVRGLFSDVLDPASTAGLVFVELHDRDAFSASESDPKTAVRWGCADSGRLSQFIAHREDDDQALEIRAKSAVLDGLRQLGAIDVPVHRVDGVPADTRIAALWMVNRHGGGLGRSPRRELVALRLEPRDGYRRLEAWDDEDKLWTPYRQYLLKLPGNAPHDLPRRADQRFAIERRIRSVIHQLRGEPTLLLVNSGNLRQWWTWISNSELVSDMVGFGEELPQRTAAWGPDLRLVLIRNGNGREEVPQWYAPASNDESAGFAAGLWQSADAETGNRVFASMTDVPASAGATKRTALKILTGPEWSRAPGKMMWNPGYLEITVASCLSRGVLAASGRGDLLPDEPADWAAVAHQMRMVDDYVPLAQPAVLHWAALTEEYMLRAVPDGISR